MNIRKSVLSLGAALVLSLAVASSVVAEDWQNLVQPLGTLLIVESADVVNARLGGKPPFDTATDVTTIKTSKPQYFVRFYNPSDPNNPSGAVGSWVMRSATVRGLTRAQVRDRFALPSMPAMMTMVLVPTDAKLYTGIAAPIDGWGAGGGQQSKLIGPPWVPAENFMNQQAIGDCILCYRVLAATGNAHRVALYLDGRIPDAYSDLEDVYTQLDLLYYGPTGTQFRAAVGQVSPLRYDNLVVDALRAQVLFNDTIDQRISTRLAEQFPGATPESKAASRNNVWVQTTGSSQRAGELGFNTHASGIVVGADARISEQLLGGISGAFVHSDLSWVSGLGSVKTDYAKAGAYVLWQRDNWFVQGGLNMGVSHGDGERRLVFGSLSRTALASPDAWEANARVRLGYRLPLDGVNVVPDASFDYFYQRHGAFSEKGADSLNLQVQSMHNRIWRSHVGLSVSWDQVLSNGQLLTPLFQLGWAHEHPIDDRAITASLVGQPDSFTVYGDSQPSNALTAGVGVNLSAGRNFHLFARYNLESRQDFTEQGVSAGLNYRF